MPDNSNNSNNNNNNNNNNNILPLPAEVAAQIKSSTTIPSLASVVLGLIENSLDARSQRIEISVDFRRGSCTVEDDGYGIGPREFAEEGGLGKPYHTSKYNSLSPVYGGTGTFLTSVAALSILTITSRYRLNVSQNTIVLHHSRPAARFAEPPAHHRLSAQGHGTRIIVQNLFGNMPVRVKQRGISPSKGAKTDGKELEILKKQLVAMLLSHHVPIRVILRDAEGTGLKLNIRNTELSDNQDKKIEEHVSNTVDDKATSVVNHDEKRGFRPLNIRLMCSILSQAGYIEPSDWNAWIKTAARTLSINVRGAISLQPAPSKHVQYISLGIRPVLAETGGNVLYDEINRMFASSSFGNQEEISDTEEAKRSKDRRYKQDGYTNKQLKGGGKGVDRWPMFYIRVDLQHSDDIMWLEREGTLANISKVLGAMVHGFLKDNHFRPGGGLMPRRNPVSKGRSKPKIAQSPGDFISSWSRIKSSAPTRRPPRSSSSNDVSANMGRHLAPKAIVRLPDSSAVELSGLEKGESDRTIEWTNPISKAKILVNSRTGLEVSQPSMKRPATAPSNLQSSTLRLPRPLTRSTSFPTVPPKEGSWAGQILSKWENPVFSISEQAIPQVSVDSPNLEASEILFGRGHRYSDADIQKAFAQPSSTISARLSKEALKHARVIAQVDEKFILISTDNSASNFLVLVDQHAADERIRVEVMLTEVRTQPPTLLAKPIVFEMQIREQRLFADHSTQFEQWGIRYDLTTIEPQKHRLAVKALPQAIAERCRVEPKVLIELLRGEAWKLEEQSGHIPHKSLPQGILNMLNSRACRSAIMFNDKLSLEEANALIRRLADCSLPFQCAHGRPSMVPLVDIGTPSHFGGEAGKGADGVQSSFGQAWKLWKANQMI